MKFKSVILFLVLGIVLIAFPVRGQITVSYPLAVDNTAGQAAAGYWEASEGGVVTVYMVKNIDDENEITVHAYVAGHTSKHAIDWEIDLTPGDSEGFLLSISNGALVVTSTETGNIIGVTNTNIAPDAEGIYRGYTIFVVTSPITGPTDVPLVVSSALVTSTYHVGINCVSVRGADSPPYDGTITLGEALGALNTALNLYSYFGRWYNDENTYGQLIIVFPAASTLGYNPETNPIEIRGRNWDEAENNVSFWMNVDEAQRIPITNNYPTSLPFIAGVGDATSGWVEITDTVITGTGITNPGMFGFTLMEEPVLGRADALPLFHAVYPGTQ